MIESICASSRETVSVCCRQEKQKFTHNSIRAITNLIYKNTDFKDSYKVKNILPIMQEHFGNSMNLARIKYNGSVEI
ncbi:hypothetical protein E5342_11330 [Parabacteroides distasonis]|uniref:Uncharacterized protein n=1 Tax=Parabacteroides distasonis TaxID=823 RepID=A0A4S2EL27_PARDI|nr:hypothetical protein E5342_11330 [Parabacteroides distasonis]